MAKLRATRTWSTKAVGFMAERPQHPTKQAAWLLVGVTVLIFLLALYSTL